jgi:hypothetical protein
MALLDGFVTDATGAVLAGATVTAGSATTTTSANGSFSLHASPQSGLVVSFSKTGYLTSSKAVTLSAGAVSRVAVALKVLATPQPLDADQGGTVMGDRGSSLTAGGGALVDQNGNVVTGSVDVSLTPLSPAVPGEYAAYPGSLIGSTGSGTPGLLQTYGVLDVTVMQNGSPVQVAPGKTVSVTIPVAATGTLPASEDLWTFNLTTGIWDHEGTATLQGGAYVAQLQHFSYHNIDAQIQAGQAACITGIVVDTAGNPVAGADVSPAEGACSDGLITTAADGSYCTWVLTGTNETITANATASPYGTGTVSAIGGTAVSFPGTYTCANLACTKAPNIVLDQPPCTTASDCQSGYECCVANGKNMCLESFACTFATSGLGGPPPVDGGPVSLCTSGSNCSNGDVCCDIISAGTHVCLPQATCTLANAGSGTCSSGSALDFTVDGQAYVLDCFGGELTPPGDGGAETLIVTASSSTSGTPSVQFLFHAPNDFTGVSSGTVFTIGADASTELQVATSGTLNGSAFDGVATNGMLTFTQWSPSSGGTVAFSVSGATMFSGFVESDGGTLQATLSGTVSATVVALP